MAKPVVFVIGASGNVGSATVKVLAEKYADQVQIRAGVRNPDKADNLRAFSGVSVVKAEMGSAELKSTLKGVDALFLVIPGAANRVELATSTAQAAKEAGVKHAVVISGSAKDLPDTILGQQLNQIETAVKATGVPYTFLCLPFFFENYFGFKDTIKAAGAIYGPVDPTKPFISVSVADIGRAAAAILVSPAKHAKKSYLIIGDCHTYGDVAAAFGEALGKTVTYNRVSYEAAKQSFLGMGIPELLATGLLEMFKLIDDESPIMTQPDPGHYNMLTGEQATNLKAWVAQVKDAFQ